MSEATLTRCKEIREQMHDARSLSYTELARSTGWRDELGQAGVFKVGDSRGRRESAWVVSQDCMDALLELVEQTEAAREEEQVEEMLAARGDYRNWMQGDELADAAMASYLERRTAFEEALDGRR